MRVFPHFVFANSSSLKITQREQRLKLIEEEEKKFYLKLITYLKKYLEPNKFTSKYSKPHQFKEEFLDNILKDIPDNKSGVYMLGDF